MVNQNTIPCQYFVADNNGLELNLIRDKLILN